MTITGMFTPERYPRKFKTELITRGEPSFFILTNPDSGHWLHANGATEKSVFTAEHADKYVSLGNWKEVEYIAKPNSYFNNPTLLKKVLADLLTDTLELSEEDRLAVGLVKTVILEQEFNQTQLTPKQIAERAREIAREMRS